MATRTESLPATSLTAPARVGIMMPSVALWWREIVRFYRQRSRVVGVIASPLLFWLVIGSGFGTSFRSSGAGGQNYLGYFFPGALIMIVLFTAIFTMMTVIEDRKEGFLLSVLVALSLTALGFIIAWPMDSTGGFHAVINLFLIPLWLLSGSMFPLSGASIWIRALMRINPLTYGTDALRMLLYPGQLATNLPLGTNLIVLAGFTLVMFGCCFFVANRRSTKPGV